MEQLGSHRPSYLYINASEGTQAKAGQWATGRSPDGQGELAYDEIRPLADDDGLLGESDPLMYGTAAVPAAPSAEE